MVTEYIKRNQKMGYDDNGILVYKVALEEVIPPVVEETPAPLPVEEPAPSEEI